MLIRAVVFAAATPATPVPPVALISAWISAVAVPSDIILGLKGPITRLPYPLSSAKVNHLSVVRESTSGHLLC